MAGADEDIETFMSITGLSESVAIQKLTEHAGNLNEAIDAYFAEGDGNITTEASLVPQEDIMELDDPIQLETDRPPFPLLPSPGPMNPFSLLDRDVRSSIFDRVPTLASSIFDRVPNLASRGPFVSHPREVREIPIEVKDGNEQSSHSGHAPTIQDITGAVYDIGPEIHGTVMIDEEDNEDFPIGPTARVAPGDVGNNSILGGYPDIPNSGPSAPGIYNIPDYSNDIEDEMIRAAIEASKQDTESSYTHQSKPIPQQSQFHIGDSELAQAVSLSLKTADQERALCELGDKGGSLELDAFTSAEVEALGRTSSGRLEAGGRSVQDETDEAQDQSVMPHPPSPSLIAQRLIREQHDNEYFASLQADREKEWKAKEEAEIRRFKEQAATESALLEERQNQEELHRKLEEHQEIERHLVSKEAFLPHEPSPDDGNAVNLLVRMPDGSRQGRRFLKSHKLQHLFDFIDVGRLVRPGTYRLVRLYPRRAFSDGEGAATFGELGLSGRQEVLFLELI